MAGKRLQAELKKKHPFDSLEQEAVLNLLRTGDWIDNRLNRLFRKYGLTGSQYNVLRILRGEGRPLPCLEIANRTIQIVPAITGLIDRLEGQGMVARRRSTEDGRVVLVEITTKALAVLRQVDGPLGRLHGVLVGHLSREELGELVRLAEKARGGSAAGAGLRNKNFFEQIVYISTK